MIHDILTTLRGYKQTNISQLIFTSNCSIIIYHIKRAHGFVGLCFAEAILAYIEKNMWYIDPYPSYPKNIG